MIADFDKKLARIKAIIESLEVKYKEHSSVVDALTNEAYSQLRELLCAIKIAAETCPGSCEDPQGISLKKAYENADKHFIQLTDKLKKVKNGNGPTL